MKVPFTWKVTGWFMVGWSPEFPVGEVRPLQYFGEDLVAYRDESGELHVLEAHCKHLGAHIGHGGKVVGDCVQCPFHGWRWGPDGTNRYIPYQPDRPNRALRLRVFPVREQYDCVFIWHQPGRQGAAVGDAGHLPQVPAVRDRSGGLLPAVSGVLPARGARTGASPDRGRERPRQRPFRVRAPRHGDTEGAGLEDRRPRMAIRRGLARRTQRQPRGSRVAFPQPLVRPRRSDQRVRGRAESSADLHLHAGR